MTRRRSGTIRPALVVLVVSVLALTLGSWAIYRANTSPVTITRSAASPGAADRGTSTDPTLSPTASTTAAPGPARSAGRPRELVLGSVSVSLPVVPVGVAADGQMELPDDPADIGWYRFGPAPGDARGSAVLAGHVDSKKYGVGPLARLRGLQRGDSVTIRTSSKPARFRVTRVEVIAKKAVPLARVFARTGRPMLRIVTCGGPYVRSRGGYQDNVIVTAVPR